VCPPPSSSNAAATTAIYTLSLHDALPISTCSNLERNRRGVFHVVDDVLLVARAAIGKLETLPPLAAAPELYGERLAQCVRWYARSEEHTSELQSRENLVCRLLLEKKKQTK